MSVRSGTGVGGGRMLRVLCAGWLGAGLLASGPAWGAAGEVVNLTGRVSAATADGAIRSLAAGATVDNGDTIVTGVNSLVRIKFVDDAYVILRPNTRFQIEDYQVSENAAENRSVLRLLKGGLRTVTGLIGRRNQSGYQMRTAVSTIGIRGTDYELLTCQEGDCGEGQPDGDYVAVKEGEIEVETDGGTNSYQEGEFGYVADANTLPIDIPADAAGLLSSDPLDAAACE